MKLCTGKVSEHNDTETFIQQLLIRVIATGLLIGSYYKCNSGGEKVIFKIMLREHIFVSRLFVSTGTDDLTQLNDHN